MKAKIAGLFVQRNSLKYLEDMVAFYWPSVLWVAQRRLEVCRNVGQS